MEVKTIAVDQLHPNAYNPNVVEDNIMAQLKGSLERDGIQQPIIVRPSKKVVGKFEIIDGEHRWRAAKRLNLKEVPYVVKEASDAEAMVMTINMNKLRGEFDTIKLAEVLKQLQEVYTQEQLNELIGYSIEELASHNELLDFNPEDLEDEDDLLNMVDATDKDLDMPNTFEVSVSLEQLEIIEAAIAFRAKEDRPKGISAICTDYLCKRP